MNWKIPELQDVLILQECAINNNVQANNYSAVNSFLYANKFNSKLCINKNWICEKIQDNQNTCYSFPHNINGSLQNQNDSVQLLQNLENLVAQAFEQSGTCIFKNITQEEKDQLLQIFPAAQIIPTPETSDYIYSTQNLSQLPGSKYSKKRNHINQFTKKYSNFTFEPLSIQNLEAAKTVEKNWLAENPGADLEIEQKIIHLALDNFEFFAQNCSMTGGLLFVENTPVAFCLASTLSSQITDIHFEKCIAPYAKDGGYAVINNQFAKTVKTPYINREEDLGIEGLRKAKLSYYPDLVLPKFNAIIQK